MSERGGRDIRNKGAVPNRKHFVLLAWAAVEFAQEPLEQSAVEFEPLTDELMQFHRRRQQIGNDALAILKQYQQQPAEARRTQCDCKQCGQPFIPSGPRAQYCSPKCRTAAWRAGKDTQGFA